MSTFMTSEEFSEWAATHSPQEVEQMAIEQQAMLRDELLESAGLPGPQEHLSWEADEFQAATGQGREQMLEKGAEVWLDEAAEQQEAEPVGTSTFEFGDDGDVEIDVPVGSKLAALIDRGCVRTTLADDSPEAQTLAQAEFVALHPEFSRNETYGNLLRDRVAQNGGRYFTVENLETAMRELVAEGQIEIGYEFYK